MKSIRKSIVNLVIILTAFIGIFFSLTPNIVGATASDVSPQVLKALGNPDEFRNFGLSQGRRGLIYISSKSMDWNYTNSVTSAEASGNYTEEILQKLFEQELSYRIMNPADEINGQLYIMDENSHIIFYGYCKYHISDIQGGQRPKFTVWQYHVYLFSNVDYADIIGIDESGETSRTIENVGVSDGQIRLSNYMAGKENAILAVHFKDGTSLYIRLGDGTKENGATGENVVDFAIDNHYMVKNPSVITITALQERPTVYLQITGESKEVKFDVAGIYTQKAADAVVERPTKVVLSTPEGLPLGEFSLSENNTLNFPRGNYRIRFIWQSFGDPGKFYFSAIDGGNV